MHVRPLHDTLHAKYSVQVQKQEGVLLHHSGAFLNGFSLSRYIGCSHKILEKEKGFPFVQLIGLNVVLLKNHGTSLVE